MGEGVDLFANGDQFYITVGSNDEIAPYESKSLRNPNPAGDQPQEEKKEDVVDADYEEVKK